MNYINQEINTTSYFPANCKFCDATISEQEQVSFAGKTIKVIKTDACMICLENFEKTEEAQNILYCGHIGHEKCLDQWLIQKNNCPTCRDTIQNKPKIRFSNSIDCKNYFSSCDKPECQDKKPPLQVINQQNGRQRNENSMIKNIASLSINPMTIAMEACSIKIEAYELAKHAISIVEHSGNIMQWMQALDYIQGIANHMETRANKMLARAHTMHERNNCMQELDAIIQREDFYQKYNDIQQEEKIQLQEKYAREQEEEARSQEIDLVNQKHDALMQQNEFNILKHFLAIR